MAHLRIHCTLLLLLQALPTASHAHTFAQDPLPDVFRHVDGREVEEATGWPSRAAELRQLFREHVYGFAPPAPEVIVTPVTDVGILGGRARLVEVQLSMADLPAAAPSILLAIVLPTAATEPVPMFLGLNKCGNHTLHWDEAFSIRERSWYHAGCSDGAQGVRGQKADFWCLEVLISRGYGLATFCGEDIDPDRNDFSDGIHPWYPNLAGETRWGTLAAWSWGLSRAIDHLEQDPRIDAGRISLIGHSRRGKTALLTAAMDERVALVVPHQSGTGGCALSRNNDQETVELINTSFPHWFSDSFLRYNSNEAQLPVDQHLLVALVAPRPIIETIGLRDRWANYDSSLIGLRAASPVWSLLGSDGMRGSGVLESGATIDAQTAGRVLQYRLDTGHILNAQYWHAILDFADLHLAP